ncbi:MAG TPA: tetratricopeptide repeat protein, partial [Methanocella sp.]|nr:tetratricopeptide repeat protein [Methanocella sp.]
NRMPKIGDHFREGMKMYLAGGFDDALGEFVRETAESPAAEAFFGTGACTVRAGNLAAAVPPFREAVRLDPGFREAHTMLGILYERQGLPRESAQEYEKGVKEAWDRVRSGGQSRRRADDQGADPSYHFYQIM